MVAKDGEGMAAARAADQNGVGKPGVCRLTVAGIVKGEVQRTVEVVRTAECGGSLPQPSSSLFEMRNNWLRSAAAVP
jgi:hypothetical protein